MNDHQQPPTRVRPGVRRAAIAACIVLLPLAARALWEHIEMRRLMREMDGILAKGEPVVVLGFDGTTDEHKRSATQYLAAAVLASQIGPAGRAATAEMAEWIGAGVARKHPDAELAQELRRLTDAHLDALRLMDSANGLEFRGFNPGQEFSYRTSSVMLLAQVASARTLHLALEGRGDEAAQSAIASLRLRRAANDASMYGVRQDHQTPAVLSLSSPSDAALRDLQAALEASEQMFDPAKILVNFRARLIEAIWGRMYGDPRSPHSYRFRPVSVGEWVMRPWLAHQLANDLRVWDEMIDAARRPWPEKVSAVKAVRDKHAARYERPVGRQGRFLPRLDSFVPDGLRDLDIERFVGDRASRIAVAITRYRLAHGGAVPSRLEDVVPAYLAAVPQDPLSGKPMRLHTEPGAFTVYSVGMDGDDDGGDLASELKETIKRGWGPRHLRGQDIGVRVLIR